MFYLHSSHPTSIAPQAGAERGGGGAWQVLLAPAGGAGGGAGLPGPEGPEGSDQAAAGEESKPEPAAQDTASQGVRNTAIFPIHTVHTKLEI